MRMQEFAHVLVVAPQGIIMQHRDNIPGIYHPDGFGAFGGHLEGDEIPEAGARRELGEETNLPADDLVLHHIGVYNETGIEPVHGEQIHKRIHGFYVVLDEDPTNLEVYEGQGSVVLSPDDYDNPRLSAITALEMKAIYDVMHSSNS